MQSKDHKRKSKSKSSDLQGSEFQSKFEFVFSKSEFEIHAV